MPPREAELALARAALASGQLERDQIRAALLLREELAAAGQTSSLYALLAPHLDSHAREASWGAFCGALSAGAAEETLPDLPGGAALDEALRGRVHERLAGAPSRDPPAVRAFLARLEDSQRTAAIGVPAPHTSQSPTVAEQQTLAPPAARGPAAAPPRRIGGYELLGELARGGMGVVYRARDPQLGREVALKLLHAAAGASAAERTRFETEARAAAKLRHPNVVAVYAAGTQDGLPYLAMELVEGESLRARVEREGPLDPGEAVRIAARLALALAAAHAQGILHRDLKPANVLLRSDGEPLLTDFGLAKEVDASRQQLTATGQILGTPAFMAPEQAEGDLPRIDQRADVYGLGATLFALLCGRPPFVGATVLNVLAAVIGREPPRLRRLRPELPAELETLCLKCLEKDPARRYASALELASDLDRFARGEPIAARPPSLWRRAARALRRRGPLLVAGVLALALLGAGGLAWRLRGEAAGGRALAELGTVRRLIQRGRRVADLEARVQAALRGEARSLGVLLAAAEVFELAGRGEAARALLDEATRAHPPAYEAWLALHRLEQARTPGQRFTSALESLLRVAAERADGAEFRAFALGERSRVAGDLPEAIAHYDAAAALAADFAWTYLGRALAREDLGEPQRALADYGRALDCDPELVEAYVDRGMLLAELGRTDDGLRDLQRACALAPGNASARFNTALLLAEDGEEQEARAELDTALAADPGFAPAYLARARLRLEEEPEAAEADLGRALTADPADPEVWLERGVLRAALGNDAEALQDLERAAELAPDDPRIPYELGLLHAAAGAWEAAQAAFTVALGIEPAYAEAYYQRALSREAQGDLEAALLDLGNALTVEPRHLAALDRRAALYARAGERERALSDLRRALGLLAADDPRREVLKARIARLTE